MGEAQNDDLTDSIGSQDILVSFVSCAVKSFPCVGDQSQVV